MAAARSVSDGGFVDGPGAGVGFVGVPPPPHAAVMAATARTRAGQRPVKIGMVCSRHSNRSSGGSGGSGGSAPHHLFDTRGAQGVACADRRAKEGCVRRLTWAILIVWLGALQLPAAGQ